MAIAAFESRMMLAGVTAQLDSLSAVYDGAASANISGIVTGFSGSTMITITEGGNCVGSGGGSDGTYSGYATLAAGTHSLTVTAEGTDAMSGVYESVSTTLTITVNGESGTGTGSGSGEGSGSTVGSGSGSAEGSESGYGLPVDDFTASHPDAAEWGMGSGSGDGSGSDSGTVIDFAHDDTIALDNDSFVIIPVLDNDTGGSQSVISLRQGVYGTASIHDNGQSVIYNVGPWVGQKGYEQVERMATEATRLITEWEEYEIQKINGAFIVQSAALENVEDYLNRDHAAFNSLWGTLSSGAGTGASVLAVIETLTSNTAKWVSQTAAAGALIATLTAAAADALVTPGDPNGGVLDSTTWSSNALDALIRVKDKDLLAVSRRAAGTDSEGNVDHNAGKAAWDMSDPDSWVRRNLSRLVPMTTVNVRYKMEAISQSGVYSGVQFVDAAGITIDLGGRKDYGVVIQSAAGHWQQMSGSFETVPYSAMTQKQVYGEVLKQWAGKIGEIKIHPGAWEFDVLLNIPIEGEVSGPIIYSWTPSYWYQPGFDGFGFGAGHIAEELNGMNYFVDDSGHDWGVISPYPEV